MKWRVVFAAATPDSYGKIDPLAVLGVFDVTAEDAVTALKQAAGYYAQVLKEARYVGLYAA